MFVNKIYQLAQKHKPIIFNQTKEVISEQKIGKWFFVFKII